MCSEYFPGRYLNNRGYRAIVVDNDSDEPEVYHLGTGFHVNTML